MLINNLREHREKYSQKLHTSPSKSLASYSSSKIGPYQAKTENDARMKSKMGSQKKLKGESTFRNLFYTSSQGERDTGEFCNTVMQRKIGQWGQDGMSKFGYLKSSEFFRDSERKETHEPYHIKLHKMSKIQKRPQRKHTKSTLPVQQQQPPTEPQKLSTKEYPSQQKYQNHQKQKMPMPPTKANTRTDLNSPSVVTTKSNYKSIVLQCEKTREDIEADERVMGNLKINEVFFCVECYRYVFAIEKPYHYPACKQPLVMLSGKEKYRQGLERLAILVQLSEYTKYKKNEIKKLYDDSSNNSITQNWPQPPNRGYFSLFEIQKAAHLIISKFISDYLHSRNSRPMCSNVRCDVDHQI